MRNQFVQEWKTTIMGLLVIGVGVIRYKGWIDNETAAIAISLFAGIGLVAAADSKKQKP